jgi:hypothetical protein
MYDRENDLNYDSDNASREKWECPSCGSTNAPLRITYGECVATNRYKLVDGVIEDWETVAESIEVLEVEEAYISCSECSWYEEV